MFSSIDRRRFLGSSLLASSSLAFARDFELKVPDPSAAWFLIGDTHYLANIENPEKMDEASQATNQNLIDQLNRLPGSLIPENAGGGSVAQTSGVIHAGDLIDSGDKDSPNHRKMQRTEWSNYAADYGLTGQDGRLKLPLYEVYGNHDSPSGDGHAVKQIVERNKKRPGLVNVSDNGLHYSWDWGGVHFVNLGIVVGEVAEVVRKRRYHPRDSLKFLQVDLLDRVGNSGRPVVLTHHIDVARYSTDPLPTGPATSAEWDPADVHAYYLAIRDFNVIAIQYGHTHARNIYRWDGTAKRGEIGIPTFNVDNSAHFASKAQAIFYFQFGEGELVVREIATGDRWETINWTPQVWRSQVVESIAR